MEHAFDHAVGEFLLDSLVCSGREILAAHRVRRELRDRVGEALDVALRHDHALDAILDRVANQTGVGADDWQARGHRLQDRRRDVTLVVF